MPEIDLHGLRVHEAESAVLRFVDHLFYQGIDVGRIVHGFGVIADRLPGWLAQYPHVRTAAREQSNPGATLVWLDVN